MRSLGQVVSEIGTLSALAMPGLSGEMTAAFGEFWGKVEAFKIEGGVLSIVSSHPALHWFMRMRRREILDGLRVYGIHEINSRRKV